LVRDIGAPAVRTRTSFLLSASALALLCALALAGPGRALAVQKLNTGVSNIYSNEAPAFQQVRSTGSTLALAPLRWNEVAPSQLPESWNPEDPADPHYNWDFIDKWVVNAVAQGLTPILDVRGAPRWAEGCTPTGEAICKPDPAALAAFTRAAVKRFSGSFGNLPRVTYWQGLNEPNLSLFFEPQYEGNTLVSPDLYRTLINTFYAAVKSVEPSNIVLMAGLGPIAVPNYTIGPIAFAKKLLCMGGSNNRPRPIGNCAPVNFDIFDVHPYTTGGPTHKGGVNDVEMGDLQKLQTLLHAADKAGRIGGIYKHTPLWVSEFGWDSNPPDPGGLSTKIEAQWVSEALYEAYQAKVENFLWYSLADFPPEPNVPFNVSLQTGLYYYSPNVAAQQPKPFVQAFRFPFVAIRKGKQMTFWGRTPTGKRGRVALQIKVGKGWRVLRRVHANAAGIFKGAFATEYGKNRRGAVRAVVGGQRSYVFPMKRVGDFQHPPFG
jgi:hypothetical protein